MGEPRTLDGIGRAVECGQGVITNVSHPHREEIGLSETIRGVSRSDTRTTRAIGNHSYMMRNASHGVVCSLSKLSSYHVLSVIRAAESIEKISALFPLSESISLSLRFSARRFVSRGVILRVLSVSSERHHVREHTLRLGREKRGVISQTIS